MLAHHPLTGKEIRILTTEASVWKENKTLEYTTNRNSVWDTIHTNGMPTFRIVLDNIPLQSMIITSKSSKIIFVAKKVIDEIGVKEVQSSGINNLVCLEEMSDLFPHLGVRWDGSVEDAVTLIAGLLRYRYVKGIKPTRRAEECNIKEELEEAKELWWVTQYYVAGKAKRRREIDTCLKRNLESKLVTKVILLNEKKEVLPESDTQSLEERIIGHRITYKDVLEAAKTFPDNVIVAFANADICIDDNSWKHLWELNLSKKCLALLRYDISDSGEATLFGPRADSQDTWVIQAKDVKGMNTSSFDIQFGKAGCDNAVAMEFLRSKFMVTNPAHSLKTWHYHSSQVRGYNPQDVVDRPAFLYILPTGIHDLMPVMNELSTMVLKDCFQTEHGLLFDRTKMYIGKSEEAQKTWSTTQIHGMTPTVECKKGLVIPFTPEDMKSKELYLLHIISKVIQLRTAYPTFLNAEWFCPEKKEFIEALQLFRWHDEPNKKVPVIRWEPQVHLWCHEALAIPVGDKAISKKDVEALRSSIHEYQPEEKGKRVVIWEDGKIFTEVLVSSLEELLEQNGWDVRVLYPGRSSSERIWEIMRGASAVVCSSSLEVCAWNWLLPKGATVITNGVSELSSVCELNEVVLTKVSPKSVIESILDLNKSSSLPTVWVPRKNLEGYFGHAGDSFREMARLWGEKGFCRVKEHPTATQVWWGNIGEVLLYDRPNHDWRLAAPVEERSWKYALFGNPRIPTASENSSPWFFWPRRPSLVETRVEQGLPSWEERTKGLVFYGKTENKVQERRRTTAEWSTACAGEGGEWVMVKGAEPYPFTQAQYIDNLAQAKFGLCLAGYGYKCHREIECMAMGSIPLVAPECDMDSYLNPPVEGKHYIRVKSPEEAREVAANMSKEGWEELSANGRTWWKENCSTEGSFRITLNKINSLQL
jgi:hypothetical protein